MLKFVGRERNDFGFVGSEFDRLREMLAVDLGMQNGFDGMIGGVAQLGAESESGGLVIGIELGRDERRAESDFGGIGQKDFSPDAHVFVGRSGIPVDPGEAEIVFVWSENFDGKSVFSGFVEQGVDAKFVRAIRAGYIGLAGDFFAVEPDVGAIVDAEKMEPGSFVGQAGGRGKFGAKPERAAIGTIGGHVAIGERLFTTERSAREVFQVHAVIGIRESFVCNQGADDGAGNFGFVPIFGGESGSGDGFGGGLVNARRLQLPRTVERDTGFRRRGRSSQGRGKS